MHKRYGSNYSLWPEQARPRRAIPLTTAVGGFAIGIVCAVAAYNVVTDFLRPVSMQQVVRESAVAYVPINTTATAPVTAADPVEPGSRTRSRRSVAKVTLPTIGTRAITQSPDTDGRGDTDSRGSNVLGDTPTAPPATQPITSIEDSKPADKPSTEPSSWKTKHAARERSAKVHKHRTVRKKRERPSMYASGYRNRPYFGYGGRVTYGWGGYGGGYG
ncbi:MAG: hypothetical protein WB820_18485, partial [Rhodoplanes sp.]